MMTGSGGISFLAERAGQIIATLSRRSSSISLSRAGIGWNPGCVGFLKLHEQRKGNHLPMKRCTRCVLPETYVGISFNQEGVCNYCRNHKERRYRGPEALKEKIDAFLVTVEDRSPDYDCMIGLSGGRDSSYLLYYLVHELQLRPLAYTVDNGFIPEQSERNIREMVDRLGVDSVVEQTPHLQRCIRHHIRSWMHHPSPAMVGMLCTGCRLGMDVKISDFARSRRIPIIFKGSTPIDSDSFKRKILSTDASTGRGSALFQGYLSQIAANPRWVLNPICLVTQGWEYYQHFRPRKRQAGRLVLSPFNGYIRWEEREIVSTLENEMNWRRHPDTESTWRGDCDIALLKLYLYKKTLGYNDKDTGLSYLVRDGQLTRDEAMRRLEKEGDIPDAVVDAILTNLGFDFSDLRRVLAPFASTV